MELQPPVAAAERWLVAGAVALTALVFIRGGNEVFELPKATVLWIVGVILLALAISSALLRDGVSWLPQDRSTWAAAGFVGWVAVERRRLRGRRRLVLRRDRQSPDP